MIYFQSFLITQLYLTISTFLHFLIYVEGPLKGQLYHILHFLNILWQKLIYNVRFEINTVRYYFSIRGSLLNNWAWRGESKSGRDSQPHGPFWILLRDCAVFIPELKKVRKLRKICLRKIENGVETYFVFAEGDLNYRKIWYFYKIITNFRSTYLHMKISFCWF